MHFYGIFTKENTHEMLPRGQLYISYGELVSGIGKTIWHRKHNLAALAENELICLSVRTGFDLVLGALNFPAGSEILVSAINIPDMFSIIEHHRLKAVPISVNKHTLGLDLSRLEAAISPATKAILISHLFGSIMEMEKIVGLAKKHSLVIFEDAAQAYTGKLYHGHQDTDVTLFSFGLIKTNTAIKGAVLKFRDLDLMNQVNEIHQHYPLQTSKLYFKKIFQAIVIKTLLHRSVYTCFCWLIKFSGKDLDEVLGRMSKGFPGKDLIQQIRFRPCSANEWLLNKKLLDFPQQLITQRTAIGKEISSALPNHFKIGSLNQNHTHWVLPVAVRNPKELITYLRYHGVDATQKASSLIKLSASTEALQPDELNLDELVYLPIYPSMRAADVKKNIRLISEVFLKTQNPNK